jgi:antitoxin ParD1/3/4
MEAVMAISVDLGPGLETMMDDLVSMGRYASQTEVLREGLRLVQEREAMLAKLNAELEKGMEDIRQGRFRPAEEVFDALEARLAARIKAAE